MQLFQLVIFCQIFQVTENRLLELRCTLRQSVGFTTGFSAPDFLLEGDSAENDSVRLPFGSFIPSILTPCTLKTSFAKKLSGKTDISTKFDEAEFNFTKFDFESNFRVVMVINGKCFQELLAVEF